MMTRMRRRMRALNHPRNRRNSKLRTRMSMLKRRMTQTLPKSSLRRRDSK